MPSSPGSRIDLVDHVAQLVQCLESLVHAIALVGVDGDVLVQHIPESFVASAQAQGCLEVVVDVLHGLAVERGHVGEVAGHVLDGDLEIGLALAVRKTFMDLAGLAVDEIGLQPLPVAHEQGVGQRAISPEEAHAVEVDQQAGHGIEELVPIAVLALGEAHEQATELEGASQVPRQDDGAVIARARDQPAGLDRGGAASFQLSQHVVFLLPDQQGQLLERDDGALHDGESHHVAAGTHRQVDELEVPRGPPLQGPIPGHLHQRLVAVAEAHRDPARIERLVGARTFGRPAGPTGTTHGLAVPDEGGIAERLIGDTLLLHRAQV